MASLMRSMFAVRSRFTEDRLARAAARGVRQYVMFGAGLDTFPWRQPDFAKDMQIFAVDHPASLIQTNQVFRQRRFARPPNLVRVPLDLEQRRIEEQLTACDFDRNTASFCSSLGLMLYLEDEIVDDILRFVVSLPPPSEVVFSFVPPDEDLNGIDLEIARRAAAKFATIGEPWKSRVGPQNRNMSCRPRPQSRGTRTRNTYCRVWSGDAPQTGASGSHQFRIRNGKNIIRSWSRNWRVRQGHLFTRRIGSLRGIP